MKIFEKKQLKKVVPFVLCSAAVCAAVLVESVKLYAQSDEENGNTIQISVDGDDDVYIYNDDSTTNSYSGKGNVNITINGKTIVSVNDEDYTLDDGEELIEVKDFSVRKNRFEELSVNVCAEDLKVVQDSIDLSVHFEFTGNWSTAEIAKKETEESFTLTVKKHNFKGKALLTVHLPKNYTGTFCGSVVSGDMEMKGVNVRGAQLESNSGTITVKDCQIKKCSTTATSGFINLASSHIDDFTAKNTSGGVTADGYFQKAACETISGSVELHNNAMFVQPCSFNAVSGSIHLYLLNGNMYKYSLSSTVGGIKNKYKGASGSIEVTAGTVSGNIKIE